MINIGSGLSRMQPSVFKRKSGASLEYLFAENGSIAPYEGGLTLTVSRLNATASRWKIDGTLDTAVPANEPRIDYDPSTLAYQNLVLRSQQFDQSPWSLSSGASVVANTGIAPDGTLTAYTATFTSSSSLFRQNVTLTDGDSYTFTIYARSLTGNTSMTADLGDGTGVSQTVTSTATRLTFTMVAGSNDWIDFRMGGAATVEIWGAQLNTGSTALPYKQTVTTTLTEYAAKGLLVEEARTNSIRNNSMQGAAAGTPGTLPTHWVVSLASGLSQTVVGTGVEDGIDYIDIRVFGTTTATGQINIRPEGGTSVTASVGQTWTSSMFVSLVGGSLSNTNFKLAIDEATSGGAFLVGGNSVIAIGAGRLATQRYSFTRTLTNASVATVRDPIFTDLSTGVAIDVTLRIGVPQLEQGAFATSVIRTTSAATLRNADVCTVNSLTGWYNATEGTVVCEFDGPGVSNDATGRLPWAIGDSASFDESIYVERAASSTGMTVNVIDGGAGQIASNSSGTLSSTVVKHAFAFKANDFAWCKDGGAVSTDSAGTLPTVNTLALGKASWGNSNFLCGHIKRLAYFPRRLTSTELQQYTT